MLFEPSVPSVPSLDPNIAQITTHAFVLDIRSTRLSLTASLKSAQLASNLNLMQILVSQAANRLSPQAALERYYLGNTSADNWIRPLEDYDAIFTGDMRTRIAVQARIYPRNTSTISVLSRTADSMLDVQLPYLTPSGQNVTMGDAEYGFIPELYPRFDVRSTILNSSATRYEAEYEGRAINNSSFLLSGPYRVNDTLSLVSITLPIINNTSNIDTLGWLTAVLDASLITNVVNQLDGLGNTGLTMLFGPDNDTNHFPRGYLDGSDGEHHTNAQVRFLVPPTERSEIDRHRQYTTALNPPPFDWLKFPAIKEAFVSKSSADSIISTSNEENENVAVGYAIVDNPMVDWAVVVEQTHSEVWAPIYNLRKVIIACVFGTMGALVLLAFPIAHYSSRPIRRLRDAAKKTVDPHLFEDDSLSSSPDAANDSSDDAVARKEGWLGQIVHYRSNHKTSRLERKEAQRRRQFRIPSKVKDRKHFIHDELTDLTRTFNEMTDELMMQYERLEERVQQRTAELEQSKKAAEAANESKTLFIANISHELKTPLNGILGMCAVCMSEDDPVKLRRSLGIIYKSGDLLLNLLTDLLTFR
jgi:osomolarity two-component system sensor histidine kinase SLN1